MEIGLNTAALSIAGRDKGRVFAVVALSEQPDYVMIADGRLRTLQKPKKKKVKHLRPIGVLKEPFTTNRELHNALKAFDQGSGAEPEGGIQLVEGRRH